MQFICHQRLAALTCPVIVFAFLAVSPVSAQESLEDEIEPMVEFPDENVRRGHIGPGEHAADPAIENPQAELDASILPPMREMQKRAEQLLGYMNSKGDRVNPLSLRRCREVIEGLRKACSSRAYVNVFALADLKDEAWPAEIWENPSTPIFDHDMLGFLLHHCMEQYIFEKQGILSDEIAAKCALIAASKIPWESEGIEPGSRIHSGVVFVCNPTATIEALKDREIDEIVRVVGGVETRFDDLYGPNSSALPLFKSRYAAQRELILAKHKEIHQSLNAFESPAAPGEISKTHLHALRNESRRIERIIELVENGTTARNSPFFPKLKAYKAALDRLVSTMRLEDVKELILAADPFEAEWAKLTAIEKGPGSDEQKAAGVAALGLPAFFYEVERLSNNSNFGRLPPSDSPPFEVLTMDLHSDYLAAFADNLPPELFEFEFRKTRTLVYRENENSADLFVLFPDLMVSKVKSLPLVERKRILEYKGDLLDTPEKFFGDFTANPERHAKFLVARYLSHKAEMDAAYKELVQWHTQEAKEE